MALYQTARNIRLASGSLTAAETTGVVPNLGDFKNGIIVVELTTLTVPDADDEVDFYVQTSYDDGDDWYDMINLHVGNASAATFTSTGDYLLSIHQAMSNKGPVLGTDGTLADDTSADIPLGDRIRIKTAVTGATAPTYAYNAHGFFWD